MSIDAVWMEEARALGRQARLLSPPNPWVGCVVVREGVAIGRGYTQPPGGWHAERIALQEAGEKAVGSTLYTTLEPCCHWGRTPPCVSAIIAAGVARVVVALLDPDSQVAGRGVAALRAAGLEVEVGQSASLVAMDLEPYLYHRRYGLPWCVLKAAVSIDGRIAAQDNSSQWITSEAARRDAHRWRAESQAIVIGAGTARFDQPHLTVRHPTLIPHTPPLRVLFDARGTTQAIGPLFDDRAQTLVYTTEKASADIRSQWQQSGAEVEVVPSSSGGVDLTAALRSLAQRGVLQLLVEGGPTLHGSFLQANLAQCLVHYVGNVLLGEAGKPLYHGQSPSTLAVAPRLTLSHCQVLDDSACLVWKLQSEGVL